MPASDAAEIPTTTLEDIFTLALDTEIVTTEKLKDIASACLTEQDYITFNFIQTLLREQLEEEDEAKDRIDIVKNSDNIALADSIIKSYN